MSERMRAAIDASKLTDSVIKHVSADYRMKAGDRCISADSASAAIILTLPGMAEAAGKFYFVIAPNGASNDVSVVDGETQTEIPTYGDMDADGDHALFYCTGISWLTVVDGVA